GRGMSFFGQNRRERRPHDLPAVIPPAPASEQRSADDSKVFYQELIDKRPALLDEKLKLHTKIIDEFNLPSLERLSREELIREIRSYVVDYVRTERISLNQRELDIFSAEIIDEMIGFGP